MGPQKLEHLLTPIKIYPLDLFFESILNRVVTNENKILGVGSYQGDNVFQVGGQEETVKQRPNF